MALIIHSSNQRRDVPRETPAFDTDWLSICLEQFNLDDLHALLNGFLMVVRPCARQPAPSKCAGVNRQKPGFLIRESTTRLTSTGLAWPGGDRGWRRPSMYCGGYGKSPREYVKCGSTPQQPPVANSIEFSCLFASVISVPATCMSDRSSTGWFVVICRWMREKSLKIFEQECFGFCFESSTFCIQVCTLKPWLELSAAFKGGIKWELQTYEHNKLRSLRLIGIHCFKTVFKSRNTFALLWTVMEVLHIAPFHIEFPKCIISLCSLLRNRTLFITTRVSYDSFGQRGEQHNTRSKVNTHCMRFDEWSRPAQPVVVTHSLARS